MKQSEENNSKRLARLAAVQALYQMTLLPKPAEQIIKEFRADPQALLHEAGEGGPVPAVDFGVFSSIVEGVTKNTADLDVMIAGAFNSKPSAERLEILLRAILRAGVYELHHQGSVPTGIIINDYVDITHAFFGAKEPGLVNGILDKLAKTLRSA